MFRTRVRRFVVPCVAIALSAVVVLPAIGDTEPPESPPRTPPLLFAPPLFTTSGVARDVSAAVTGRPDTVQLLVGGRRLDMRPDGDSMFTGTIPADLATSDLTYGVTATYGDVTNTSENAHLVVLDNVRSSTPRMLSTGGTPIIHIGLGAKRDELGISDGAEGARQAPAAFVTDASGTRLRILDTVKGRIVDLTKDGVRHVTKFANGSTTSTDLVMGAKSGLFVLDQVRDEVVGVTSKRQTPYTDVGARTFDRGAKMAFQSSSDTVYLSDATQGRFVPLVKSGRKATSRERSSQTTAGVPSALGALAAEVSGNSVLFGLDSGRNTGYRVTFADPVLDANEVTVDALGIIWGLVGVSRGQGAALYLVSVDPSTGNSTAVGAPLSLPGDVTRRLAAADDGVVLMSGTEKEVDFTRFRKGDGR